MAVPLLSYSCMFQVEICSQQLEICKSVCMFIVLAIIVETDWSDDCRSWPREEKINNHGCWGKHAHIPDNDYRGICLFHVVWTNFCVCNYSYVVHTHHTEYIYIYIYVWKLNQTVLELDFRAVKYLFFSRRDLNPHHWYTAAPFA